MNNLSKLHEQRKVLPFSVDHEVQSFALLAFDGAVVVLNVVDFLTFDLQQHVAYFHLGEPCRGISVNQQDNHTWTIVHRSNTASEIWPIISISKCNSGVHRPNSWLLYTVQSIFSVQVLNS